MYPESVVRDVAIVQGGKTYTATYFVEHGIITANLEGRMITVPCGQVPPEDTVRALLLGRALRLSRRNRVHSHWTGAMDGQPSVDDPTTAPGNDAPRS